MANKKTNNTKTKKVTKKNTKKTNKKNNSKKNIIIISSIIVVIIILILLIIILSSNKTIECNKKVSESDFNVNSNVLVYYKKDNINKIEVTKKIAISNNDNNVNYLSMVKSSMNNLYKEMGLNYKLSEENNKLVAKITYNKPKKYIIDNIYIEKENEGISFNVIKEDTNNSYATFDLSKKYSKDNIIKILNDAKYICK